MITERKRVYHKALLPLSLSLERTIIRSGSSLQTLSLRTERGEREEKKTTVNSLP